MDHDTAPASVNPDNTIRMQSSVLPVGQGKGGFQFCNNNTSANYNISVYLVKSSESCMAWRLYNEVVLLNTIFKVERAELTPVHILLCQVITFILLSGAHCCYF